MRLGFCRIILAIAGFFFMPQAWGAEVTKVKGQSALINLQGEPATPGDEFFAINSAGKKKAILVIRKVKGDKAIARIAKGKADAGMTLQAKAGGKSKDSSDGGGGETYPEARSPSEKRSYMGVLLGFAMDTMEVDLKDPDPNSTASLGTVSLSGNSFSGKALFDYRVFPKVWFRGTAGLESFVASGAAKCKENQTTKCDVNIYYISFDALGRYKFSDTGSLHPWLGAGFSLMFPASKSATALDNSSISNTSAMTVAGGVDWQLGNGAYIPLSLEYAMLPKSDEVSASWIAIRAGYAF